MTVGKVKMAKMLPWKMALRSLPADYISALDWSLSLAMLMSHHASVRLAVVLVHSLGGKGDEKIAGKHGQQYAGGRSSVKLEPSVFLNHISARQKTSATAARMRPAFLKMSMSSKI